MRYSMSQIDLGRVVVKRQIWRMHDQIEYKVEECRCSQDERCDISSRACSGRKKPEYGLVATAHRSEAKRLRV